MSDKVETEPAAADGVAQEQPAHAEPKAEAKPGLDLASACSVTQKAQQVTGVQPRRATQPMAASGSVPAGRFCGAQACCR